MANAEPVDGPTLRTERLVIRPGVPDDRPALVGLYRCEGVARWWGAQTDDDVDGVIENSDPDVTRLVIEREGAVIGMIQYHEEDDPMYRHAGIDVAIHDDHQRVGLGPEAIRAVVAHLATLGHHRIVIDPNAANAPAIAAYERVGFRPVGTMRSYEWSEHAQAWTDGLFMELLISDLDER